MKRSEPYLPEGSGQNFAPNTIQWVPGDLVLHDADAKREDMLMRVVNYTPEGLCRTEYVENTPDRRAVFKAGKRSTLINRVCVLHDPNRFGVEVVRLTEEQRDILSHSLGLGRSKKPYRNYYCANHDDGRLPALVALGLMKQGRTINNGENIYFHVTAAGAKAIGSPLPKDD